MNEAPDVAFIVLGEPGPQGSKSHDRHGKMFESSKKVAPWRDSVAWVARMSMGDKLPLEGPLRCEIIYTLPKPKSAPKRRRTWPDRKPDGDKLDRSTHDAMTTAGVWKDDAQVVEWSGGKRYPMEGEDSLPSIGARIRVWRIKD
jgi:crossover junction endodeoxyribonuclease RusA